MLRRRRWLAYGFALVAFALLPWTGWLTVVLPSRHVSSHWGAAWVGFDLGELIALALTAWALFKRARWLQGAAAAAGTMLVCDAWFDTLLSTGDEQVWVSIGQALLSELPLAAVCFWIAVDAARFYAQWGRLRER